MDTSQERNVAPLLLCLATLMVVPPLLGGGRDVLALPVAAFVAAIAFLLAPIHGMSHRKSGHLWLRQPIAWFGVFVAIAALELFTSVNRYATLVGLCWLVVYGVVLWIGMHITAHIRFVTAMLVGMGTLIALIAFMLRPSGADFRVYSSFYNPNALAGYVLLPLFAAIGMIRTTRGWTRAACIGAIVFLFVTLLATGSVTAWIAFLVGAIILFRTSGISRRIRVITMCAIIGIFLVGGAVWVTHRDAVSIARLPGPIQSLFHRNISFSQRKNFIAESFQMLRAAPIFGTGYGTWGIAQTQFQKNVLEKPLYAHNEYVQIAAETGVVGIIALLGFFIVVITSLWSQMRDSSRNGMLLLALLAGVGATAVHGGIDFALDFPAVALSLWLFLGVVLGKPAGEGIATGHQSSSLYKLLAVFVLFGVTIWGGSLVYGKSLQQSARQRFQSGDVDRALQEQRTSLRWNPDPRERRNFGAMLEAQHLTGFGAGALEQLQRASKENPREAQTHNLLGGELLIVKSDAKGAELEFKKALELDPMNNPHFATDLAQLFLLEFRYNEAHAVGQAMLDRYARIRPSANPQLGAELGQLNKTLGDVAAAQKNFSKAILYYKQAKKEDATIRFTQQQEYTISTYQE